MSIEVCVVFGISSKYMVLLKDSTYKFCASDKQCRNP